MLLSIIENFILNNARNNMKLQKKFDNSNQIFI